MQFDSQSQQPHWQQPQYDLQLHVPQPSQPQPQWQPQPQPMMPVPMVPAVPLALATPRNETMKMWAIILLVSGHVLGIIGGVTLVIGIGICILPLAVLAEIAGFVCLCLI